MLSDHYWKAFQGFLLWKWIDRKCHVPMYILMPEEKDVYNYYALLHLDQFLQEKGLLEAAVLTCDEEAIAALNLFFPIRNRAGSQIKAVHIRKGTAKKLLKYYALHEFTSRIAIVSLTEPYDTHGQNLLGLHGVDKEELVCRDIYRLQKKPEAAVPQYSGTDERIAAFLNRRKAQTDKNELQELKQR